MSNLSVKEKAALLQSGFSKGFNSLNNNANRRNKLAANLAGLPMTSANNDHWNNNNNALSANGEIPANLFVSPPGSPTGLNNNSASNVGSVASRVSAAQAQGQAAQAVAAQANVEAPVDPYAITANRMAKAKAKFNKINANKRAAAAAASLVSSAAPVAASSSNWSPFNMYRKAAVPVNQGPKYGPELQAVMARAFSKAASEAAARGATYEQQQNAGRAAAQYAEVMKIKEYDPEKKAYYYPGVKAEAEDRASVAYIAEVAAEEAAAAARAANPKEKVKKWATVNTGHRGKSRRTNRKTRKNRRNGRK